MEELVWHFRLCSMSDIEIFVEHRPARPTRPVRQASLVSMDSAGRRGRPSRDAMIMKDGPLVLAVLVGQGQGDGRWSAHLVSPTSECRALAELVNGRVSWVSGASSASDNDVIVGLAVLRQWRYVVSSASDADMHALMRASMAFHRKRGGQRFFEHAVVAAACVMPLEEVAPVPPNILFRPATSVGQSLVSASLGTTMKITKGDSIGAIHTVESLLKLWWEVHKVSSASAVAWPLAHPLAQAMASGVWGGTCRCGFSACSVASARWHQQFPRTECKGIS